MLLIHLKPPLKAQTAWQSWQLNKVSMLHNLQFSQRFSFPINLAIPI
jgi:hypothetical protein